MMMKRKEKEKEKESELAGKEKDRTGAPFAPPRPGPCLAEAPSLLFDMQHDGMTTNVPASQT